MIHQKSWIMTVLMSLLCVCFLSVPAFADDGDEDPWDADDDGYLDLLSFYQSENRISFLINNGQNNFTQTHFILETINNPYSISMGIFNNSNYLGILVLDNKNVEIYSGLLNLPITSIEKLETNSIIDFQLSQNFPNPFNPSTTIRYTIPKYSKVKIDIYNILGRKIERLVNEFKQAGDYEVEFDGSDYASGIYTYIIIYDNKKISKKMILIK